MEKRQSLLYSTQVCRDESCNTGQFIYSFIFALYLQFSWRTKWQPTPVFLPGEFHGQNSLVGYSPCSCKEFGQSWVTNSLLASNKLIFRQYSRLMSLRPLNKQKKSPYWTFQKYIYSSPANQFSNYTKFEFQFSLAQRNLTWNINNWSFYLKFKFWRFIIKHWKIYYL